MGEEEEDKGRRTGGGRGRRGCRGRKRKRGGEEKDGGGLEDRVPVTGDLVQVLLVILSFLILLSFV